MENILNYVLFVVLFALIIYNIFINKGNEKSKFKGNKLEYRIDKILKSIAKKEGGIELNDLMFNYNSTTTQIDNILLTRKALYIIEAKDYSGFIYGSQNRKYWTQTFIHRKSRTSGNDYKKSGVSKYKFYNPIKQNQTHISVLNNLTDIKKVIPIYNVTVFGHKSTLKELKHNPNVYVVYEYDLNRLIDKLELKLHNEMTVEQQLKILDAMVYLNIDDNNLRLKHISRIKTKYSNYNK